MVSTLDKIWNELVLSHNKEQIIGYLGEFKNGSPAGTGRIIFSKNEHYQGEIFNGQFHGDGIYFFKDKSKLISQFNNNQIIKGGQLILSDGRVISNQFLNIEDIKNQYLNFPQLGPPSNFYNAFEQQNYNPLPNKIFGTQNEAAIYLKPNKKLKSKKRNITKNEYNNWDE